MRNNKRIMTKIITIMTVVMLLTGCYPAKENVVRIIEEPKEIVLKLNYLPGEFGLGTQWAEEEMSNLGLNIDYTPLEDVNTNLIHEVVGEVLLPEWNMPMVEKVSDGFIVLDLLAIDETDNNLKRPVLYRLDTAGKLLWQKEYEQKLESATLDNLVVYPDGRILFSISHWPEVSMGAPGNQQTHILQCDAKGTLIWEKAYDDFIGSRFKDMFLAKEEQIICVGEWFAINGIQTSNQTDSDIVVTLLDAQGEIIKEVSYGGTDSEYCQGSIYDQDMGLIFSGWSLSKDGELVTQVYNGQSLDYVACVDSTLTIQWVHHPEAAERYYYDQVQVVGNHVYLVGYKWMRDGQMLRDIFIEQLDEAGKQQYKTVENNCMNGQVEQAILENGDTLLIYGGVNEGVMVLYNKEGEVVKRIEELSYAADAIVASRDGGFVVKAFRQVASLPQPIYISSIWIDLEVNMMKYDADLNLIWRKTYDTFKKNVKVDWVNVY